MLLCSFLILSIYFKLTILNTKSSKSKYVKMIGKTVFHSYPNDWWPLTPTTIQSLSVTRTIPHGSLHPILSRTSENHNLSNFQDIKPTKFIDYRNSKAYRLLWERTNRGFHWLPPNPKTT